MTDSLLHKEPEERQLHILVIHGEEKIRLLFKGTVENMGHTVEVANNGIQGLRYMKQSKFDLLFLSLEIATPDDAKLLNQIKQMNSEISVIIIADHPHGETIMRVLEQGNFKLMKTPSTVLEITTAINEEKGALPQTPKKGT
jgi:DNA-binding NtrC family response regulator